MKCPQCHHENPDDAKFCNECANKLELICPECKKSNPPGSKFCNECAHNLTITSLEPEPKEPSVDEKLDKIQRYLPKGLAEKILSQRDRIEGERKQVTVMFCDMQGFTELTEMLGPEETYSIMDQIYEFLIHKVHDYEGTVNEMTGDGIVALFGAPIALEDAPQRAIWSALAIHREMVRFNDKTRDDLRVLPIKMRIGIHTGPVVVGTVGNDLRVEFKAVGDTVNLAARMEGIAEPGTTYVTEDTFKLTEGLFRFEGLGDRHIKGRDKPVMVYRVLAPSSRRTRFDVSSERGLTPFIGRERELELILDGFERAKSGRGQAFSVVAEAGIGKSRLLYEFRKIIASEDVTFLEGKCLSYSKNVAYHPLIDILMTNFKIREGDGDLEIKEKIRKGIEIVDADEASTLPYFLELLSVKGSGFCKIPLSPEVKKARIIEALKQIVLKLSELRPMIMAIEDLHWMDKSSEDAIKKLLEAIPGARVLLLFTYRPEFVHTWGAKSFHSQVNLNRLSNRESLLMVSHLLGTDELDKKLEEFILEKTEGIPFFIEELIKSLKDLKVIAREKDKYRIKKDIKELTIPATIQDVIMARVDSLPQEAKELLQTVAAVGRESSYDLIRRVSGLAEQELMSQLSLLKDSELLYERGIYPQSTYIFKHSLTQEVVYNSLILIRKKEIHEGIGRAIEAQQLDRLEEHYELLAYHYGRSANSDKAVKYLDLANQKADKLNAMEEAKTYFEEAMALLDSMPENEENRRRRISLLVNQGFVFFLLIKAPEHYDLLTRYEPTARGLGNPKLLGAFYARLGQCEWLVGHYDQGIQTLTKAIQLSEAAGRLEDLAYAKLFLICIHFDLSNYDQVFTLKEEALRILEQKFDPRLYVFTLSLVSRSYASVGRWDEASETGKKALNVAEEHSDNSLITFAAWNLSITYGWKVDTARAIEYGKLAIEKAQEKADIAWAQRSLGWAWCRAGEHKKGIELLVNVLPSFSTGKLTTSETDLLCFLGEGYWLAGDESKARQTLEEGLVIANRCGARFYIAFANRLLGEISLRTEPLQAAIHFERCMAILEEIKAENELALAYKGYSLVLKHKHQIAEARGYLSKALEIFERLGTLLEADKVRNELNGLPEA
jgi:class 3 adenylate cyclase/tetratricopeptide (TPR) repeat protein